MDLYSGNLTVINEKGEESPIVSLKLGSKFNDRRVTCLLYTSLPEMKAYTCTPKEGTLVTSKNLENRMNLIIHRGADQIGGCLLYTSCCT